MEYKERRFEQDIETYLLEQAGYVKANKKDYDADKALDLKTLIGFIKKTQPDEWKRYEVIYGDNSSKKFYKRFSEVVNDFGLIHVLRYGIDDRGVNLRVCYFKPESTLNSLTLDRYRANVMSLARQFYYSTENANSIDMVLSLNGIPIVAMELKNQFTGQSVENAKKQYIYDRNPRELCFNFNKRFLVYFAVDLYQVWMTTQLKGKDTYFLPFNQGSGGAGKVGGLGNPENPDGYNTAYLWQKVLRKDSLMNIIQRFLHLEVTKSKEIKNGKTRNITKKTIIFPRYHQLDVVTKLISHVQENGAGKNYLIQHSAGSGKSNSIAWTAYRLSSLHDDNNNNIFTSVIIVTDRRVLDSQLQGVIASFDHRRGVIETIDDKKNSQDLKNAINAGVKIIVTTLQKFPVIFDEVENTSGKRFAVIVDEAHSSQTGTSAQKLKTALADNDQALEEFAQFENTEESNRADFEDKLIEELQSHGKHRNLSFFAFTATPKEKTLEMFGQEQNDGTFHPFHIYSMKQAIEEGFIHDVLAHYMTYNTCFKIAKEISDNPELPESEATKAIKRYQSLHPYNLQQKTAVMVEYFRDVTRKKIGGKAKAMLVTASRLHAVRYYHEFKRYIEYKKYNNVDVLVAFSGTVKDGDNEYTEVGLNIKKDGSKVSEKQLKETFHGPEFNILIVAEKYQTGFDEPLLHTMFVDKKLSGVKAVQTLSRLNRTRSGKTETFVMDFVNEADDIRNSFTPFYKETVLDEEINVNLIYNTKILIREFYLYSQDDIEQFNIIYYSKKQSEHDLGKLASQFTRLIKQYLELDAEEQFKFKKAVRNFVKWYAYITQITRLFDKELHKEYNYLKYLAKVLPNKSTEKVDLEDKIKLEYYRLDKSFEGDIQLEEENENGLLVNPKTLNVDKPKDPKDELLDVIINHINDRFSGIFDEGDKVIVETLFNKILEQNSKLKRYAKKHNPEIFNTKLEEVFESAAHSCYAEQMGAFKKLFENAEFYNAIMSAIGSAAYSVLGRE